MPHVQLRRAPKRQPLSLGGVEFAPDSVLEEGGFELVWGFSCQVVVFGLLPVLCSERESRSSLRRLDLGNIAVYTTKPAERVTTLKIQVTCYAAESRERYTSRCPGSVGPKGSLCIVVIPSVVIGLVPPVGTITCGMNTLKVVDPTSTVIAKVTLTIVPMSGTSAVRISDPAKLRLRTASW
jgi:hypothetical protein